MQPISLAAKAVENPEILATLGEADIRGVLGTLTMVAAAAHAHWLAVLEAEKAANEIAPGNRLISMKEVARRLGCSVQTVLRGSKAGRYPFVIRDGGRVVGSEGALERWIEARAKRQPVR